MNIHYNSYSMCDYILNTKIGQIYESNPNTFFQHWHQSLFVVKPCKFEYIINSIHSMLAATLSAPDFYEIFPYDFVYLWGKNAVRVSVEDREGGVVSKININGFEDSSTPIRSIFYNALVNSGLFIDSFKGESVEVQYAFPSANGVSLRYRNFQPHYFEDISQNYSPVVVEKYGQLVEKINSLSNGLVIFNGSPGTGKTHLVRALMTECRNAKNSVVCIPPLDFLRNLGLLVEAVSTSESSLVILEDLGDILTEAASEKHVEEYSNLLNVTDGLMSLLAQAVIVLTFNTNIGDIKPALLRAGRCISHIEVGELSKSQAQSLLAEDGLHDVVLTKSFYTLAEVYEIKNSGGNVKTPTVTKATTKKTMGFAR